jgi:LuxR family transcriptional regulator of csgAB operon
MASTGEFTVHDWVVYILGQQNIRKGLLASFLEREFNLCCQVAEPSHDHPSDSFVGNRSLLVLRDCLGEDVGDILSYVATFGDRLLAEKKICLALINVSPDFEVEAKLLERGVRGVISGNHVAPDFLLRFVKAILSGELWFPRHLISRCILESRGQIVAEENESSAPLKSLLPVTLSEREKEVLMEIGIGSTNDQIADHLCISQHTVKSHIYRIFRKIHVPNRLQAALWASKYLA